MRARVGVALLGVLVLLVAACGGEPEPPVVDASEETPSEAASPAVDAGEARLAELRATDQFDEFAEHERAAKADGARLAWENFAPIVDGKRVEWTNKAELWDSIAPKIRDEALLLGPEYRKPLWNNNTAVPNGVSMAWNDQTTGGRGHFVEFGVTWLSPEGPMERYWGFLVSRSPEGSGVLLAKMPPIHLAEADYANLAAAQEHLSDMEWAWVSAQEPRQ